MAGVVAEAKCPICLDLLKDPVTTKCGHNFCRSCMQKSWEDECKRVSCPLCQQLCQHKILKQNNQLRNILYGAKLYLFSMEMKKKKTPQCKKHKQVLNFFCEDDHKVLCDLCTRVHWSCNVKPLKQIASHHRKQIMDYVTTLRNQLDDYTNSRAIQEKKVKQVNQSIAKVWHKLNYECKHMNHFLEWQHNICVSRAAYVERVKQKIHKETCSNCISIRTCLKQEVAERSVIMDNIKLLTRIKNIYNVCDNLTPPSSSSIQLSEREANLPPLFKPLKKIKAFKRDVTLDPETAHPSLLIPEVKKSVTFVMEKEILLPTLKRFSTFPLVLGSEGFDSGRHYWEVRVNDKPEWMVGVCEEPLFRKDNPNLTGQNGYWMIQLSNDIYVAQSFVSVHLELTTKPRGIGIYLDYELGEVSFYNLHTNSHIHSFFPGFSGILKPFFMFEGIPNL